MLLEPFSFPLDSVKTFGVAFVSTLGLLWLMSRLPFLRQSWRRQEKARTSTWPLFFRLGGLALVGGFLCALFVDTRLVFDFRLTLLLWGGVIAFGLGVIDDLWPLHWARQLGIQLGLGVLLFWGGMTLDRLHVGGGWVIDFSEYPGLVLGLTLVWVVLIMNAINWVDGVDGLMGGVMSIAFFTLYLLSLRPEVNQPALALLSLMLLGALVAFLLLNWFPAKILAGTGGAAFLGFMLAALSVYAGTKVATALLVLVIPVLDVVAVVVSRLQRKQSPFLPSTDHLHHILLSRGWSPRQIALMYMSVTVLMAVLALSTQLLEKIGVLLVVAVTFFGLFFTFVWRQQRTLQTPAYGTADRYNSAK